MLDLDIREKAYTDGASNSSVQFRGNNDVRPEMGLAGFALRFFTDSTGMPGWWTPSRDVFLRSMLHGDSLISGIVYGETARVKNMPYKLEIDKTTTRREYKLSKYQDMLNLCQFGQGIRTFAHLFTLEYLTQDNGVFVELIGKGGDRRTERPLDKTDVISMAVLDSSRCWRTYDPEYPVIYVNPYNGERNIMHYSRVYYTANFQQNNELARGVGLCALSRAYEAGRLILATNTYIYEKVTGQSPEIGLLSGMSTQQFQKALAAGGLQLDSKGFLAYKDITIVGQANNGVGATPIDLKLVGLKNLPDGFDREKETNITVSILANAFGVDIREIWRAISSGDTKADAEVQDQKSEGKGRADAIQALEDCINWRIMPDEVTYSFDRRNTDSDKREAEIYQMRASARSTQIASGEISVQEAREIAIESGDLPPDFADRQSVANDVDAVQVDNQASVETNANQEGVEVESDPDSLEPENAEKAYFDTSNQFYNQLLNLTLMGADRAISKRGLNLRIQSVVKQAASKAYLDGIKIGAGNNTITTLDPDEQLELTALTSAQLSYVSSLVDYIYDDPPPSATDLINRVTLWQNKGLNSVYNAGLIAGRGNLMMKWTLGATESHCKTCSVADGQVHRGKEWKRANIIPQGDNLHCNGFRCDCKLEPTTEKAKGRLSRIPNNGKTSMLDKQFKPILAKIFGIKGLIQ